MYSQNLTEASSKAGKGNGKQRCMASDPIKSTEAMKSDKYGFKSWLGCLVAVQPSGSSFALPSPNLIHCFFERFRKTDVMQLTEGLA